MKLESSQGRFRYTSSSFSIERIVPILVIDRERFINAAACTVQKFHEIIGKAARYF
jgi:hypothetical protein